MKKWLLFLIILTSCNKKAGQTVSPITAPITEAVFASGHIESSGQFTLTALNDGYITDVPVVEGDTVKTGQLIFKQDNASAAVQARAATENLAIANANASSGSAVLQQLEEQLNTALSKLSTDKAQQERMQRLYATNSVAKVDLDNADLAYRSSVNNVSAIRQNIAATKLSLQQSVINSRSTQQTAAITSDYYNIKSPGNYTVYTLLKRKGDLVRKGDALAILGNNNSLIISLLLDEASIAKIKLGQKVLVELNTEKGKTYYASVSKIYPLFDTQSQSYKVDASFDNTVPSLINGTLLQANIIVAKKDKALLIPRSCLSADGKVMVKDGKKIDTIRIETGIISTDWVEVIKGVTVNDKLIR